MLKSLCLGWYFWYDITICTNSTFINGRRCDPIFSEKYNGGQNPFPKHTWILCPNISIWKLYAWGNNDLINISWISNKCCPLETQFVILLHVFLKCLFFPLIHDFSDFLLSFYLCLIRNFPILSSFLLWFIEAYFFVVVVVEPLTLEHLLVFSWIYSLNLTFG